MTLDERYRTVAARFEHEMPDPKTELHFRNPYQLLVAVILSAQCTDKRVNMVTPAIFEAFPTPEALAKATPEELLPYISSISYPNNKTKSLLGMARKLVSDYGGQVPDNIDDLLSLPGVGRKTANVILSVIYDRPAMAVDTHVFRVAGRLGLTRGCHTPLAVEKKLTAKLPAGKIARAHHWLILHGRYVCQARKPKCSECFLADICPHKARLDKESTKEAAKKTKGAKDIKSTKDLSRPAGRDANTESGE